MINEKMLEMFNGFYTNPVCREKLYSLYSGVCQGCGSRLFLDSNYHVGHIIPRSQPEVFSKFFEALDVDNIINLNPLCSKCNLSIGDNASSIGILNQMYSYNYKKIKSNFNKLIAGDSKFIYYEPDLDKNLLPITLKNIFETNVKSIDIYKKKEVFWDNIFYYIDIDTAIINSNFSQIIVKELAQMSYLSKILASIKTTFKIERINDKFFLYQMYINPKMCSEEELSEILKIEAFLNKFESVGLSLDELRPFLSPLKIGGLIYEELSKYKKTIYGYTLVSKMQNEKTLPVFVAVTAPMFIELGEKYKKYIGEDKYIKEVDNIVQLLISFESYIIKFFDLANNISLMKNRRFSSIVVEDIIKMDLDNNMGHSFFDYNVEQLISMNSFINFIIKNNISSHSDLLKLYGSVIDSILSLFNSFNINAGTFSEKRFRGVYKDMVELHKKV